MIAAISAKLKAGRPAKAREGAFKLEGIPHPELFTPEQRQALRASLHLHCCTTHSAILADARLSGTACGHIHAHKTNAISSP